MSTKPLKMGLAKALLSAAKTGAYSPEKMKALQRERLIRLVSYTRENSPYFAELYKDLPENFTLADIPPTNKRDMMANFDEYLTARDAPLAEINAFMRDKNNIGKLFKGKYLVFTTSGSTGNPAVVLYDKTTYAVTSAIDVLRSFARKEDMRAFIKKGKRTAGVFATGGFYLGAGSVVYQKSKSKLNAKRMMVTSILKPTEAIVRELNDFDPVMLGGYPTALELLMDEKRAGRLRISPSIIMAGGEYMSDQLREALAAEFGCYVQSHYSCTEGGSVACECRAKRFHISEDWCIVESVDENGDPVPDGTQGAKLYMTVLSNYTQPFIRYEVTDRAIMEHGVCPCGKTSPTIEIEGRTDDILTFKTARGDVRIQPLALYAQMRELDGVQRFQIVQHGALLEVRLAAVQGSSVNDVFERAKNMLTRYLASNGVTGVRIYLSYAEPSRDPGSGKFKHVLKASE